MTYVIITQLETKGKGFSNHLLNIGVLFYADDGLVMAQSLEDAKANLEIIVDVSRSCGLEINKDKSSVTIWNMKEQPTSILGIKVQDQVKYLGIVMENKRNVFKQQKKIMLEKAHKMANMTLPIIHKSCQRLLIGKTFWKSVALPSILYGSSIVSLTDSEIGQLQRIENSVFRQILGAPKFAPNCTLRGEIGASEMKTRIMKGRLSYVKNVQTRENQLLKNIMEDMEKHEKSIWTKTNARYRNEVGIKAADMHGVSYKDIQERTRKWDSKRWEEEVKSKSSRTIQKVENRNQGRSIL